MPTMVPGVIESAHKLAAGELSLFESLVALRVLTDYIWCFTETHGGKEVALLPEQQRLRILPGARPINPDLRTIADSLEINSVRTVLLKLMSRKTVQDYLNAAERYDEWLETLELSLNLEFWEEVNRRISEIDQESNAARGF